MRSYTIQGARPAGGFRRRFEGELNPQQLAVVTAPPGPLLVLAGAGSGKTRAVTYRVAWLLDGGEEPERIVLLTFTNKAASEMLKRVEELVPVDSRRLWGGTFHSVANRILRRHAGRVGFPASYTILDREDARELVDAAISDCGIDPRERRFPKAQLLLGLFSYAVNTLSDLSRILIERHPGFADLADEIGQVARRYGEKKRERAAMDYDDLLRLLLELLEGDPLVREHYADRFRHVLVDEYQDTNRLQARIVETLGSRHRGVLAVGDDAQSIYAFRGADYANILDFARTWPDAAILKLEVNYRSTPEILALANASIRHNTARHDKTLEAVRPPGPRPARVALRDAGQQAAFVASRILELRDEGVELDEIAVLYRSHWHALEIQMELARRRVPFEVRSGIRFFETAHVKDVLAFLRIARNPRDEVSWRRVLKLLPRVGSRTADRLFAALAGRPDPLAAVAAGELDALLPAGARTHWPRLRDLIGELGQEDLVARPAEMIRRVLASTYRDRLYETFEDAESRLEDLDQLAVFALGFADADSFLADLALSTNLEGEAVPLGGGADEGRVVLSTVHQAKGLEWRAVFLVWLADGRFPSARSLEEKGGEEEERRLFYVAVTRTRDELYLCHPLLGRDAERTEGRLQPSRFLAELDAEVSEPWQVSEAPAWSGSRRERGRAGDGNLFDDGPFPDDP